MHGFFSKKILLLESLCPSVREIPSASWIYASCIHALGPGSGFGGSGVYIIKMQ